MIFPKIIIISIQMIFVLDAMKEEELERMLEAVKNKRTDIAQEKPQTTTIPRMEPASMLDVIDMQLAQSDDMPSTSSAYNQEQVEFALQSIFKAEVCVYLLIFTNRSI